MKPRIRPISNLYFKYGRAHGLEALQVRDALFEAGAIELVGTDHYREFENKDLSKDVYESAMHDIVYGYKARRVKYGL